MRGAEVRTLNESVLKQPITKLFLIKYFKCQLDENVGENSNDNVCENMNENMCDNVVRPKRNVAIAGEIRRLFSNDWLLFFYTDWFVYYFRNSFNPTTLLPGEYKNLLYNTRLVKRDHYNCVILFRFLSSFYAKILLW